VSESSESGSEKPKKNRCRKLVQVNQDSTDQRVDDLTSRVPNFLAKVFEIVEVSTEAIERDPNHKAHIFWNPNGKGFIVDQPNKFSEEVLPLYFKTN